MDIRSETLPDETIGFRQADYEALTYRFNGRDMRLTDVHDRIIKEILA